MSGNEEQVTAAADSVGHSRYGSVISTRPLPLDVERRKPWNSWWHKAIHFWRYGYSHPDEDLLGVIEAVGDALHVQAITAKAQLRGDAAAEAGKIKDELDEELKQRLPDFSTLLGFEARLNALYPPEMARRRQWVLRDRFDRVAPAGAMQYWQAERLQAQIAQMHGGGESFSQAPDPVSDPPSEGTEEEGASGDGGGGDDSGAGEPSETPPKPSPLNDSEADAQTLLGYIHTNYLMTIGREKAVRDLKRWLLMRFFLFLLVLIPVLIVVWIALWLNNMGEYWGLLLGLFLIAAAGRAGATTSVINRLQKAISANVLAADPIVELAALRTGKNEISMALLSSSIFALLMWAFFASGVPNMVGLDGGIFPRSIIAQHQDAPPAEDENKNDGESDSTGGSGQSEADNPSDSSGGGDTTRPGGAEAGGAKGSTPPPTAEAESGAPSTEPPQTTPPAEPETTPPAPTPPANARRAPPAASRPDRPREVRALENRVVRMEDAFRERMAAHRAATGILNWVERRRIRQAARNAIQDAIANQDALISWLQRQEDPATWARELRIANLKHRQLVEMSNEVVSNDLSKPGVVCQAGKDCNPFPDLATALRLLDESDFFKMLLWAFIAGFAERFVPDMLDRVVARGKGEQEAEADAALAAQVRAGTLPSSLPPHFSSAGTRVTTESGP